MNTGLLYLVLIVVSVVIVVISRHLSRRNLGANRQAKEIELIHAAVANEVGLVAFRDVLVALGDAYSLDPKLIRPDDPLRVFMAHDSWSLGDGTDEMNKWLADRGLNQIQVSAKTVLDLARIVDSARMRTETTSA